MSISDKGNLMSAERNSTCLQGFLALLSDLHVELYGNRTSYISSNTDKLTEFLLKLKGLVVNSGGSLPIYHKLSLPSEHSPKPFYSWSLTKSNDK